MRLPTKYSAIVSEMPIFQEIHENKLENLHTPALQTTHPPPYQTYHRISLCKYRLYRKQKYIILAVQAMWLAIVICINMSRLVTTYPFNCQGNARSMTFHPPPPVHPIDFLASI